MGGGPIPRMRKNVALGRERELDIPRSQQGTRPSRSRVPVRDRWKDPVGEDHIQHTHKMRQERSEPPNSGETTRGVVLSAGG